MGVIGRTVRRLLERLGLRRRVPTVTVTVTCDAGAAQAALAEMRSELKALDAQQKAARRGTPAKYPKVRW